MADENRTDHEVHDFELENLTGSEASRRLLLAHYRAGFDPRSDEDMSRLSEHLRRLENNRINSDMRNQRFSGGIWTAFASVVGLAAFGMLSIMARLLSGISLGTGK